VTPARQGSGVPADEPQGVLWRLHRHQAPRPAPTTGHEALAASEPASDSKPENQTVTTKPPVQRVMRLHDATHCAHFRRASDRESVSQGSQSIESCADGEVAFRLRSDVALQNLTPSPASKIKSTMPRSCNCSLLQ